MKVQNVHQQFEKKKKTAERSQQPYPSQPKLGNYSSSHQLQQSSLLDTEQ